MKGLSVIEIDISNMDKPNPWINFWPAWVLVNAFGWLAYTLTIISIMPFF